ncbi:MAG TPA: hypothetical protein VEC60_07015, partial [Reyranella sp.]|nr:hypothetical protein [Reyranella sp.]
NFGIPRWAIIAFGVLLALFGLAVSQGWIRDPSLAKSDYVGTIDVSVADAKLYRAVPFEWVVNSPTGTAKGSDTAYVRVDPSGERAILCGWLKLDKGGASIRATRWLSEARLAVGNLKVSALFIAPTDKAVGDDLNAGCARLLEDKPAADAPLFLEGSAVRE